MAVTLVVLVKAVPDVAAAPGFSDSGLDRDSELLLNDPDENALEAALGLAAELDAEVVAVSVGPGQAEGPLRRSLQIGAAQAVQVSDARIAGSDALGTARVLAAVVRRLEDDSAVPLVVAGQASVDAATGLVPAMVATLLHRQLLGGAKAVDLEAGRIRVRRTTDTAEEELAAALPAVVSVVDGMNEPRYPTFKDVMAAKRKPFRVLGLDDLGLDPATVGVSAAGVRVLKAEPVQVRAAGRIVTDDGTAGVELARFLLAAGLVPQARRGAATSERMGLP